MKLFSLILCLLMTAGLVAQHPHSLMNYDANCCAVKWEVPQDSCTYNKESGHHHVYPEIEQFIQKRALPSQNYYSDFAIHGMASAARMHKGHKHQKDVAFITLYQGQYKKMPDLGEVDETTWIRFLFEDGDTLRVHNNEGHGFNHIRMWWYTDLEGNIERVDKNLSYMSYEFQVSLEVPEVREKLSTKRIREFVVDWPIGEPQEYPVMNRDVFIRQIKCLDN